MKFWIKDSLPLFIARRLNFDKSDSQSRASKIVTRVAICSVAISVLVMIVAIAVVDGFAHEIDSKVKGVLSSFRVMRYDNNFSAESGYLERNLAIEEAVLREPFVESISSYLLKTGIAKNSGEIAGVVMRGVENEANLEFYKKYLVSGVLPTISVDKRVKEIIISKKLAQELTLESGDLLEFMFFERPPLRERFKVTGIYETSLGALDKQIVVTDIRNVQHINGWSENQIGGYEITRKGSSGDWDSDYEMLCNTVDNAITGDDGAYMVMSIKDMNPQIYSWLEIQKSNEIVIITIMLIVAAINIISMVLIILLQKLYFMGILTVLGMSVAQIRKIFIYRTVSIVIKALLIGNVLAISLLWLQQSFKLLKLDGDGYFTDSVPVYFSWDKILLINVVTMVVMLFFQWLTTLVVSKISPSIVVKYEKR